MNRWIDCGSHGSHQGSTTPMNMNGMLTRYKSRRIEIGRLFYLAPRMIDSRGLTVRTHLDNKSDFLKELWRKRRHEQKMRRNKQEMISTVVPASPAKESIIVGTLRLCGIRRAQSCYRDSISLFDSSSSKILHPS